MTFLSTPFSLATASTTNNRSLLIFAFSLRFLRLLVLAGFPGRFVVLRHQLGLVDVRVRDAHRRSILFQHHVLAFHREDRSLEAAPSIDRQILFLLRRPP